jgi:teichuronic acid biosynthesis glycosyltransferase TuaC
MILTSAIALMARSCCRKQRRPLITVKMSDNMALHAVTLMPANPSWTDEAECAPLSETLDWFVKSGIRTTLLRVRPMYQRKLRNDDLTMLPTRIRYFSLPSKAWRPISGAFLFARIVGQLRELHRKQPIDLVHAHNLLPCGHAAMLLSKELSIPYIVSVYGLKELSTVQSAGRVEKWRRRIAHRVCAESRRVVCGSEHVREEVLERTGQSCRTSVVYNGVDPELFSPGPEASGDDITVLSGGNLQASEGHDLLIRGTAALAKDFPSISLEIIGDGPERSRLQTLAKQQGLVGVVHFLGRQSRSEVAATMKRCTLFVLPSQSAGVGCMPLEAMSCARAVIGCRGQGIAELIRHGTNGFLVGPENENELTLAIGMLLRDPQRRRNLGAAARDTVLERLTAEHQAQDLGRIYRESIARSSKTVS